MAVKFVWAAGMYRCLTPALCPAAAGQLCVACTANGFAAECEPVNGWKSFTSMPLGWLVGSPSPACLSAGWAGVANMGSTHVTTRTVGDVGDIGSPLRVVYSSPSVDFQCGFFSTVCCTVGQLQLVLLLTRLPACCCALVGIAWSALIGTSAWLPGG